MGSDTSRFNVKDWPIVRESVRCDMMAYLYEILGYDMSPRDRYELRLLVWHLESEGYTPYMRNDCTGKPYSVFYFMDKMGDESPWRIDVEYDTTFMFEGVVFTFKLMGCVLFRQRFTINEDGTLKLYHLSF